MASEKNGSVYTRSWVVELILDLVGYTPDKKLSEKLVIEPSCGEGAFATLIVQRLIESAMFNGTSYEDLVDSIRFIEMDESSLEITRDKIKAKLENTGIISNDLIITLLDKWCVNDDYLLMSEYRDVDFVVGNPPYIRSNDIDPNKKNLYLDRCKTMTPGSDIFVGFIEKGLKSLGNDGKLAFICADRWMHNAYGKRLRSFVTEKFSVDNILVMHDVDAFESDVSAYPAIITISKGNNDGKAALAFANEHLNEKRSHAFRKTIDANDEFYTDSKSFEVGAIDKAKLTANSWPLVRPSQQEILDYLESNFPSLEESARGTKVGVGMATGNDKVFVVKNHSLAEEDRMIPMRTSKQLNERKPGNEYLWLVNPWGNDGTLVDLNEYPLLDDYFEKNREALTRRHVAKKNSSQWYRTIDRYQTGLERRPKLLIQDMHVRFEPYYDDSHYPHGNLYYIITDEWDLEVLGGLLMSDICETFIDAYSVKMRGGTLRFQAQFLRKIHVPYFKSIDEDVREGLREAFRKKDYEMSGKYARRAFRLER